MALSEGIYVLQPHKNKKAIYRKKNLSEII